MSQVEHSALGKETAYPTIYSSSWLFPIPRRKMREKLGLTATLPFSGEDLWTGYEVSWLDDKGKPQVAIAIFRFPCTSPNIIESKSFKLYLNSFNQTRFLSEEEVVVTLSKDLSQAAGSTVAVHFIDAEPVTLPKGECLDLLDIAIDPDLNPSFLSATGDVCEETLYSNLLKSNCPVTGQPDWATVIIHYVGPRICHKGLLRYIISFRNHNDFHENCVETLFTQIKERCSPQNLSVYARYTRRGGLDINPFRSNFPKQRLQIFAFRGSNSS